MNRPVRHEGSLIAFTLLAQTSVGCFLWLCSLRFALDDRGGLAAGGAVVITVWFLPAVLILLALASSLAHLGTPGNAWRALANWRVSWLSREVLFALLFAGAILVFACLERAATASSGALVWAAAPALLAGLGLMVVLPRVYRLRTIPAWDSLATTVSFTITLFLLGGLAAGSLLSTLPHSREGAEVLTLLVALSSVLLLGAQMLTLRLWLAGLQRGSEAEVRSAQRVLVAHRRLLLWRITLTCVGAVLLLAVLPLVALVSWFRSNPGILLLPAFVVVLASEVLGRALFYQSGVRQGL